MSEDDRWWPAESDPEIDWITRTLIGNLLGPKLNRELACLLSDAKDKGFEVSPELDQLRQSLWDCDGRPPVLLVHLYAGVVMTKMYCSLIDSERKSEKGYENTGDQIGSHAEHLRWEFEKTIGWISEVATHKYGFSADTWKLFFLSTEMGSAREWPPRGVRYRRHL